MGGSATDAMVWAQEVFGRCELGDIRRTRRLVKTAGILAAQAGRSPLRACGGDLAASEGAYRLIRNGAVEPEAIGEGGFAATARAASECSELLAVEDTTTLSYAHAGAQALGDLGGQADSAHRGFHVHSVLLLEREAGRTLGLIEQRRWRREPAARGRRHLRSERAYADKESAKWEQASRCMSARLGPVMERVVSVCDREADVYEYLRYKSTEGQRYVVRAAWDRRVHEEAGHLFAALEHAPLLGEHRVSMGQRGGPSARRAREACLEIRAMGVELRAPKRDASLGALRVNAVLVEEKAPVKGDKAVSWLLLTSEPIDDLEAARRVVRDYALRWRVEEFHKAWKSGARVEERRMHSPDNLERMAVMLAFVAVRLLQLREAVLDADTRDAERPCTEVLSDDEWQVLWVTRERSRPPKKVPPLRWAYQSIAKLGGFIDTKRTGRAGWDTMWHGWFRLQERLDAYLATRDLLTSP